MLEDPQYASIVRWGDSGDSFVVLEVCDGATEIRSPSANAIGRTINSPTIYFQNTSNTATLLALSDSSTSMTSIKLDKTKKTGNRHTVQMLVVFPPPARCFSPSGPHPAAYLSSFYYYRPGNSSIPTSRYTTSETWTIFAARRPHPEKHNLPRTRFKLLSN